MIDANLCMGCMSPRRSGDFCEECGWQHGSFPKSPLHLAPGFLLRDQYILGRVLGYGGFGVTYLGWDLNLATRLAVKEYLPSGIATRTAGLPDVVPYSGTAREHFELGLEKFLEEARLLARFKDVPNIVSVLNFFRANGTAYMVMEYLEGKTLEQHLRERGGKLPVDEAIAYVVPIIFALSRVHSEAILHRDISPDNIYLTTSGLVKLLDFGAARFALGQQSKNFSVILKEGYSPEEQYRSKGVQGPWTDVYAVAATLYRCITGVVPPAALDRLDTDELVPPRALGASISESTERTILRALAVRMQDRFQSVEDFRDALLANPAVAEVARTRAITALPAAQLRQPGPMQPDPARPPALQPAPLQPRHVPVPPEHPKPPAARLAHNKTIAYAAAAAVAVAVLAFVGTVRPKPGLLDEPVIREFRADPDRVPPGGSTTLYWSTANTDRVTIEPNVGVQSGGGKITVPVRKDTNFVLTLHDKEGNMLRRMSAQVYVEKPARTATREEPIPELPPYPPRGDQEGYNRPPRDNSGERFAIDEFSVTPQTVSPGQQVFLRWSTSGASHVKINGATVGANGASSVPVMTDSSFTLVAQSPRGATQQRVANVEVRGASTDARQPAGGNVSIEYFAFDPPLITAGQSTTLRWAVLGNAGVTITPDIGQVRSRGQMVLHPRATGDYTLKAGNATEITTVVVSPATRRQAEDPQPRQGGTTQAAAPPASVPTPARSFQVVHDHGGMLGKVATLAGRFGRGRNLPQTKSCSGVLAIQNGSVRFTSHSGEHGFTEPASGLDEVRRNRLDVLRDPSLHIKLRSGDSYNFTPRGASVDEIVRAIKSSQP